MGGIRERPSQRPRWSRKEGSWVEAAMKSGLAKRHLSADSQGGRRGHGGHKLTENALEWEATRSGAGRWHVLAARMTGVKQEMMTEFVVLSHWRETGQDLRKKPVGSEGHSLCRSLQHLTGCVGGDLVPAPLPWASIWPGLAASASAGAKPS